MAEYEADDVLYESSQLLGMNLEREQLMPGVLTAMDKVMLVAAPKAGKSLLVQQLGSALAGGHNFLGFSPVKGQHRVLYVAAEGDVDELQERGRAMGTILPVPTDRLWYWPVPSQPLNTMQGLTKLLEFGHQVKPALTILDPIYALMRGSMKDDEQMSYLMRAINRYQYEVGSAVILVHHDHRKRRDEHGSPIDEGDDSYFGSFVVKAWPRALWTLAKEGSDEHYVKLACRTQRNRESKIGTRHLTLIEPDPLIFVEAVQGLGSVQMAVMAALQLTPATQSELAQRLDRSVSSISEAVVTLLNKSLVAKDSSWPEVYSIIQE